MADLIVIVPSRGRPGAAHALARVFADTCTADTRLVFSVDVDDPKRAEYSPLISNGPVELDVDVNRSMVDALNSSAGKRLTGHPYAIGFMGDDHCPRTHGWDQAYLDALRELGTGIVYGNDLLQRERIPTQVAMTADIVRTLGYMAPPGLVHLYVDNFWRDLGAVADCLRYLPDVVIEHRHPVAGKASWDDGYRRVNAPEVYERDRLAYSGYLAGRFRDDVATVRALRGGPRG
jgi:hypothetical protein